MVFQCQRANPENMHTSKLYELQFILNIYTYVCIYEHYMYAIKISKKRDYEF